MLPYTAEVLFSVYGIHLQDIWPAPIAAVALALTALVLGWKRISNGDRVVGAILALGWIWVGTVFFILTLAEINFAAPLYGALFIAEGLLLGWFGVVRNQLSFRFRPAPAAWIGLALALCGLALYPLADGLMDPRWAALRLVWIAPGATVLFTFGMLLLGHGRVRVGLCVVPLLWSAVAAVSGWMLGIWTDVALLPLALLATGAVFWKNQQRAAG